MPTLTEAITAVTSLFTGLGLEPLIAVERHHRRGRAAGTA
jgi:hypothetical protein